MMNIKIGSKVVAWNPGADRKVTGTLVGPDATGLAYRVKWTRTTGFEPQTCVGIFTFIEVAR